MNASALLGIELAAALAGTAGWLTAGVQALTLRGECAKPRRVSQIAMGLIVASALLTLVRLGSTIALNQAGWWFVAEKVTFTLPIALATTAFAVMVSRPGNLTSPRTASALFIAGYGAGLGLITALIVGYPLTSGNIVGLLGGFAALSAGTWLALSRSSAGDAARITPDPGATSPSNTDQGSARQVATNAGVPRRTAARTPRTVAMFVVGVGALALVASVTTGWLASRPGHTQLAGRAGVPVNLLRTADGEPDQVIELTASTQGPDWVFNGQSPGPLIESTVGELVEVRLRNSDIEAGVTLHWHGYPVPAGEDGVAGVTQDRVGPGESFTYRLRMSQPGSYWYHGHQSSGEAIRRGLYGAMVVHPPGEAASDETVAVIHRGELRLPAPETKDHAAVRTRVVNTDNRPHLVAVDGAPYRIVAVDGHELNQPQVIDRKAVAVPAGGRVDLLHPHAPGEVVLDPDLPVLNLLEYGEPGAAQPADGGYDRAETLVLDRQLRFFDGSLRQVYPVNGALFPDVVPLRVSLGETLRLTVVNRGFDTHPMHPHGHTVRVVSRNGDPVTGSPLWLDTFDVKPGEVWVVDLLADNPGIWLAHCHDLSHASAGMVLHLEYDGYSSPYGVGEHNHPE